MPFSIVRNDITLMDVDAVVNAANERLLQGGGVCGAIFAAAGAQELQKACGHIGHCDTGSAVATPAFALSARHVIHAVGPVWRGGAHGEEQALRSCYRSALALAHKLGDASIAFPLISSGIYGYPKDQALNVAVSEIRAFLLDHELDVYLTVFDAATVRASRAWFDDIAAYIDDRYVEMSPYWRRSSQEGASAPQDATSVLADDAEMLDGACRPPLPMVPSAARAPEVATPAQAPGPAQGSQTASAPRRSRRPKVAATLRESLQSLLNRVDDSFSTTLLHMIDSRGLKDSEVYKRANLSRQHFSKIRSNPSYQPKKTTVLALSVALGLTLDETRLLLERAGFSLTHADKRDVVVEYFISHGMYDIYEINLALYAFDLPLLG